MFKKIAAAAALAVLASSSFGATPTGYYAGLDLGVTNIHDFDGSKSSVGGFLGYGFNRNLAIELGYRQLGKWDLYGASVTAKQSHVSVVASYPLNTQFDLYGRLGYSHLSAEASYMGQSGDAGDNSALYGVGLNYNFTPTISGRFEVQKPSSDATNYGVGIIWKF